MTGETVPDLPSSGSPSASADADRRAPLVRPTMRPSFTDRQGQYLAFIYHYSKVNRRPPAEADIRDFFNVSAPTVHQMIIALESRGFIERTRGAARSVRVLVPLAALPPLE